MENNTKRRDFLMFLGKSAALLALNPSLASSANFHNDSVLISLPSTNEDIFKVIPSFSWDLLIKWGDQINKKEYFGFNNDFIGVVALNDKELLMWVNHEYVHPVLVSGHVIDENFIRKTKEQATKEMESVGGSILHLKKENDQWKLITDSKYNRRINAFTKIPFTGNHLIKGQSFAVGTLGNCAGGVTPWNTFLSCEENYHNFFGETDYDKENKPTKKNADWVMGWDIYYDHPTEHYGWVVEINPLTAEAKKHINLGRFAHEGATCVTTKNGKVVVYMGEDKNDGCFYKFVSEKSNNLDAGVLYVANLEKGKWIPLMRDSHPELKKRFKSQLEMLVRCSEAAQIAGGTKLDRPEGCTIDPETRAIYLNCTNNIPKDRPFGSIHKFVEKNDFDSLEFSSSVYLLGGELSGIACPDNIAIDRKGNLWITSDMSEDKIGKDPYKKFGNNALFYVPTKGTHAGEAFKVAQAPIDAELTGPCFSPDGKTLFLSVQHPGGSSKYIDKLTSHWPEGGNNIPKPSVVAIKFPSELI